MNKVIPDCKKRLVGVQSGQVGSGDQEDHWAEMHSEREEEARKQPQNRVRR